MNMLLMLWAIFSLVFVILEIGHPSLLFFLTLSLSSLVAAGAAYYEYSFIQQLAVFFAAFPVIFWFFKKFVKNMHGFYYHTNSDALIGKEALVTATISSDAPGYVKVQGELWLARSLGSLLPIDSKARIVAVRGAHVVVEPSN